VALAWGGPTAAVWQPQPSSPIRASDTCEATIAQPGVMNDAEAVRAVLAGDIEQYAVLVRRYRDRYAGYATRLLGSVDAAEDAMQEALIRAYDNLGQCRDPANFRGWFFLILRNSCYAEARARRRHEDHEPLNEAALVADGAGRPDSAMEETERRQDLERALWRLTEEQREVFVLKHYEGLPYEEIAKRTAVPVSSLKMRMHRAYDRLRATLMEKP
jgi:RNA polymerase sigma-70 factor (ECF subfamily)